MSRTGLATPSHTTEGWSTHPPIASAPDLRLVADDRSEQQKWDHYIYDSVIAIGIDFLEASHSRDFTPRHFSNLRSNGMVDFDIDEVLRVFDSKWQYVQADARDALQVRAAELNKKSQEILAEIGKHKDKLPVQLFKHAMTETRTIKKGDKTEEKKIAVLSNKEVGDDQKILRYVRFRTAQTLTANLNVNDYQLQTAVLGVSFESADSREGFFSHSYLAELQALVKEDNIEVVRTDVEHIAVIRGWEDFIFPREQSQHLKNVLTAAKMNANIFPPLALADRHVLKANEGTLYFFDTEKGLIIQGDEARKAYVRDGVPQERIARFGALLVDSSISLPEKVQHRPSKQWDRHLIARAGRFVLAVINMEPENQHTRLSEETILRRAQKVGLLPTLHTLHREFDTTRAFYEDIGARGVKTTGAFDNWSKDRFLDYLREVAGGEKPSFALLTELNHQDPWNHPSPYVISMRLTGTKDNLSTAVEQAGFLDIKAWDKPRYERWGAMVMKANGGKKLTSLAIYWLSLQRLGPSRDAVIGKYDAIGAFTRKVAEAYEKETVKNDQDEQEPWPRNENIEQLKLGPEFEEFVREYRAKQYPKNNERKRRKNAAKRASRRAAALAAK